MVEDSSKGGEEDNILVEEGSVHSSVSEAHRLDEHHGLEEEDSMVQEDNNKVCGHASMEDSIEDNSGEGGADCE